MSSDRDPRASEGQVSSFAFRVLRRIHALGGKSHTLDDVKQELWIAWCNARDTYDESKGASFKTYLHKGMQLHINRHIYVQFERFHDQTIAMSLDYSSEDAGASTFGDMVSSGAESVEAKMIRESNFAYAQGRLSDRARVFVSLLKEQPQELLEGLLTLEHKAKHAKVIGVPYAQHTRLTAAMIFDLMQASRPERTAITREVENLGDLMTRIN